MYLLLVVLALLAVVSDAFQPINRNVISSKQSTKLYGLMDALNKAMANDPSLPPVKSAGLSKDPTYVTVEFLPSNKKTKAILGQKFRDIANVARVQIPYGCEKGECGTCSVKFNGKIVKACQVALPASSKETSFQIEVLPRGKSVIENSHNCFHLTLCFCISGSFPVKTFKAGKIGNL